MATRRSNGEGSTPYQRADGRWQINLRIPAHQTTTGQPLRKAITGRTRADVVAKTRTLRHQLAAGVLTDPNRLTLDNWLTHWLTTTVPARVRDRTARDYAQSLHRWVIGTPEGRTPLERLDPVHIQRIHARMREAGRSESTILKVHRILSKALRDAVNLGHLGTNPAARVDAPRAAVFDAHVVSPAKARELIRAAGEDEEFGAGFTVALALGLRQGERLGLCWEDVDLEAGRLVVRRALAPAPGGGWRMVPVKSAAGSRVWALPGPLVEVLRGQRERQVVWRGECGDSWRVPVDADGRVWDLVFTRRVGGAVGAQADRAAWVQFTAAHGVEGMRVHDARHTAATVLLSLGVAPRVVMEMMGWSSMSMLTRYQHVLDEFRVEAAQRVGGALWGEGGNRSGPGSGGGRVVDLGAFRARRSG
ncbi:tyrosine-type recombinase/integrase [Rothia kristinae]|uniref:tyrosine-type recombinase/integrase n=1 Tax=Rothia kristinae TaxID=37923 RepID=UPI0022E2E491|nr:tyrosine-type recombinase/integrase [Rothia kristinae]